MLKLAALYRDLGNFEAVGRIVAANGNSDSQPTAAETGMKIHKMLRKRP